MITLIIASAFKGTKFQFAKAIIICLIIDGFITLFAVGCSAGPAGNRILEQQTDERGLTSVIYQQNGEKFALDYLDKVEYDSFINNLKNN